MAGDRGVRIGGNAIGDVITTGDHDRVEARLTAITQEPTLRDPALVDIASELTAIRAFLSAVASEHAEKIGRALDDADEEAHKKAAANKDEVGKALERALGYAKSGSAFATVAAKLGPHLKRVVGWLGDAWTVLLTHLL